MIWRGKRFWVTAGPTQGGSGPGAFFEQPPPAKWGAIAKMAMLRGAEVTLVSGKTALEPPMFVNTIPITSAEDGSRPWLKHFEEADFVIKAAAVADYTPTAGGQQD